MAFSEFDAALIEVKLDQYIESVRPPKEIRDQFDLKFRIEGTTVDIFGIRPHYKDPSVILEDSQARAKYVKTTGKWQIFWMRADQKWHRYPHVPEVDTIDEFIAVVAKDEFRCFRG